MGKKLPDYQDPLANMVALTNGPEAIDLAQQAAEYYKNVDYGYDATVTAQGGRPKTWAKDGWERTMRDGFCCKRKELIDRLKDDNPQVRGRRFEGLYETRADEMIGEALKDNHMRPDGHRYRPEYDYKPADVVTSQSR